MKQRKAISSTLSSNRIYTMSRIFVTPAVFIGGATSADDVAPPMKTAGVEKNSGHCIYSIGRKCVLDYFSLFHLVIYIYIHICIHTYIYI